MTTPRIEQQFAFLVEADKLKDILRQSPVIASGRRENSAEHSWHLTLATLVLREYSAEPVDLHRALKMLIVHDLVEIDAGDTFAYDTAGNASKSTRERAAADRLFALLPVDLAQELRALWEEFEAHSTPEARFANAVDRIQPFLQNFYTHGGTWRDHNLTPEQILKRLDPIRTALPALWPSILDGLHQLFDDSASGCT
jgi:putative hydrolase of HD superfamily